MGNNIVLLSRYRIIIPLLLVLSIQTTWAAEGGEGKSIGLKSMLGGGGSNSSAVQTDEFSGAATYSIPISVPPGRGSVTPQLGLSYNSYRRNINSWVGYGWEMEMGSITRVRGSVGNGSDGTIDFIEGNSFEVRLGGQAEALVLITPQLKPSSYGLSGLDAYNASLYQARSEEGFTYYLSLQQPGNPMVVAWIAIDKSGTRYFFGWDDESREKVASGGISRWMLTKVQDANGQQLNIFYSLLLPVTISYADVVITFTYKTNADGWGEVTTFPFYQFGNPTWVSMSRLLDEINIQASGKLLQHYQFHYVLDKIKRRLLSQITQTAGDGKSLPPITLNYQADFNPSLSETKFIHNKWGSPDYDGTLYEQAAFADMNGDGLVDHVIAKPEGGMDVFYNDGNNFFYRPGQSYWPEPFDCKYSWGGGSPTCKGKINGYHDDHQFLFLMDINGDGLPDRVARYYDGPTNGVEISYFRIAFNTGKGWSSPVDWKDPYEGDWAGVSFDDKGFYDMNGDGLVDRVVGIGVGDNGFNVHLNTGAGFKKSPFFWADPLSILNNPAAGKLYASDGENMYSFIRDFNGDGLPDRFFAVNILDKEDKILAKGTVIFLNQNGQGWAQATNNSAGKVLANGTTVLLIADAVDIDYDQKGFINKTQDWIDVNGDGFLDRVHGNPDTGHIGVSYYQGIKSSDAWSSFQSEIMQDTLEETSDAHKVRGYLSNHINDHNQYVFFQDFNGDGLPDRLAVQWDDKGKAIGYQLRMMESQPITFSDTPSWWANKNISQPYGALTQVDDGRSHKTAIEYQPSTWPRYKGQSLIFNLQLNQRPNHRYLPFNLNVVHKLYTQDYSVSAIGGILGDIPEAKRHPGMRWVTYDYEGGYYYFRGASKKIKNNLFDDEIYQVRITRFDGFQSVKKTPWHPSYETWKPYTIETRFHQALGEVDPTAGKNGSWFDPTGYTHDSLAGHLYRMEVKEADQTVSLEETTWQVKDPMPNDNFYCQGIFCEVHSISLKKTVWNDPKQPPRGSRVDYQYDQYGNLTQEDHYSLAGAPLITLQTDYYPPSQFQAFLQLRDRPKTQRKRLGDTLYREKFFQYDAVGNPIEENLSTTPGGGKKLTVKRSFSAGNLSSLTDVDGVKKNISYGANNLFPIKETVTGAGQSLNTTRTFDRLTGEMTSEVNTNGIGHIKEFDGFGRVISESIRDAKGNITKLEGYQYQYFPNLIGIDVDPTMILEVSTYKYQTSNLTIEIPEEISYLDPGGNVLQRCQLSERGDYRMIQSRIYNGGREELTTEPVFTKDCPFIPFFPKDLPSYHVVKDVQGRMLLREPPAGDTLSPMENTAIQYTHTDKGLLEKKTTNAKGQIQTETYDVQERLVKLADQGGNVLEYAYNPVGDLTEVRQNGQLLTSLSYDLMGYKTALTDADMGTWQYHYDLGGRLIEQIDNAGQGVKQSYDGLGRVVKKQMVRADGSLAGYELYSYDGATGAYNVLPGENSEVREFDGQGKWVRSTQFSYDASYRRLEKLTRVIPDVGEFRQTFQYDPLGRIAQTVFPGGHQLAYQYMLSGQLMKVCENSCGGGGEVYYSLDPNSAFDPYGSLMSETYGNGVASQYAYYPKSHRLQSKQVTQGDHVLSQRSYEHDALDNITKLNNNLSEPGEFASLTNIQYDSLNRLIAFQPKDAALSTLTYDKTGNILKNDASFAGKTYEYGSSRPHAVTKIGDEIFTYDANGNMTSDGFRTMKYNPRNQLSQVQMNNDSVVEYEYDYTGARVKKRALKKTPIGTVEEAVTYYFGDTMELQGDKLILHIYAGDRRIATRVVGSLSSLASAGATLVDRNVDPNLGLAQIIPYALWLLGLFVLASFRPVPATLPAYPYILWRRYVETLQETCSAFPQRAWVKGFILFLAFLSTVQFPILATAGEKTQETATDSDYFYYYQDDHLNSSHLLTEGKALAKHGGITYQKGQVLQRFEYTPFGEERFTLNPNLQFGPSYTGQGFEIETGLYYYQSRYYNPTLGRFIQPDTLVPDPQNSQDFNHYSYVRNNPLKYNDPSGHGFWSFFKKIGGFLLGAAVIAAAIVATVMTAGIGGIAFAVSLGALIGSVTGAVVGGLSAARMGGNIGFGIGFGALIGGAAGAASGAIFHSVSELLTPVLQNALGQTFGGSLSSAIVGAAAGPVSGAAMGAIQAFGGGAGTLGNIIKAIGIGAFNGLFAGAAMGALTFAIPAALSRLSSSLGGLKDILITFVGQNAPTLASSATLLTSGAQVTGLLEHFNIVGLGPSVGPKIGIDFIKKPKPPSASDFYSTGQHPQQGEEHITLWNALSISH